MRIGLAYDLKEAVPLAGVYPEDALEEYDSPETVGAIARAIEALGYSAVRLGGGKEFLRRVFEEDVDLVFNIAEGLGGYRSREAQIPSVLEMLDMPYTGSDPLCLAICLDKPLTKKLVAMAGIPTPEWRVVADKRQLEEIFWNDFPFPAFVKPAHEGSSKGIRLSSKVDDAVQLARAVTLILEEYRQPALVEQFIAGDEVTVGMVNNAPPKVLGIMRVLPRDKEARLVYSLEVKRDWEALVDYECPARLRAGTLREIECFSLRAFEVLGCRDVARLDFRVSPEGKPYFLEINPLPGLNPYNSDLPIMARRMGISYEELISAILKAAFRRYPLCVRG